MDGEASRKTQAAVGRHLIRLIGAQIPERQDPPEDAEGMGET